MATRALEGVYPGVGNCPLCNKPPLITPGANGFMLFECCGSLPRDSIEWNLYVQKHRGEIEPTPEEDEAFEALDKKLHPEPEWFMADYGRKLERLGKLLQDPGTHLVSLVEAARAAGLGFQFSIQPTSEESTDEHTTA